MEEKIDDLWKHKFLFICNATVSVDNIVIEYFFSFPSGLLRYRRILAGGKY